MSFASASNAFVLSREVSAALRNDEPVVALESTIITHGMPYPANLNMARETENIIREKGAVPATIAIIGGKIHVGLNNEQLEHLATSTSALKTSRRDFPHVIAKKLDGGTTVSGTMVVAHRAGIQVFVTGGIGGVHRGATTSMDISADLTELGRTPVLVVSAGVKSILDIGLTLEYLETMGVCVASLHQQNFPAFYTSDSGFRSPYCVNSTMEAAQHMKANIDLSLNTGMLLGVPIPADAAADSSIPDAIEQAVQEAATRGIAGKEITPYILSRLNELTGGESLRANIALVKNNAAVGAQVAVDLANLTNQQTSSASRDCTADSVGETVLGSRTLHSTTPDQSKSSAPIVVGGCIFDFVVKVTDDDIRLNGSTHIGNLQYSHGGVGRNVADAMARLGNQPRLVSMLGADNQGASIQHQSHHIDTSLVEVLPDAATATYTAVLDRFGECKLGVGDMNIHNRITPEYILRVEKEIASSPLVVTDGNVPQQTIDTLLEVCFKHAVPLFYEPTCMRKANKPLLTAASSGNLTYCSPNLNELMSMAETLPYFKKEKSPDMTQMNRDTLTQLAQISIRLLEQYKMSVVMLTLSEYGVLLTRRGSVSDPLPVKSNSNSTLDSRFSSVYYPGSPATHVVSVSGAGDCLTAGFLTGVLQGKNQHQCVSAGLQAAKLSCGVAAAVPSQLSLELIDWDAAVTWDKIIS